MSARAPRAIASPARAPRAIAIAVALVAAAAPAAAAHAPSAMAESATRAALSGEARRARDEPRAAHAAARAAAMAALAPRAQPRPSPPRGAALALPGAALAPRGAALSPPGAAFAPPAAAGALGDLRVGVEFVPWPFAAIDVAPLIYGGWLNATGGAATIDGDGWPTCDAYAVLFDLAPSPLDPAQFVPAEVFGVWSFAFEGRGTVSLYPSSPALTLLNSSFDAGSFTTSGFFELARAPGALPGLAFAVEQTQRKGGAAGSGFRLLRILQPGFSPADLAAGQFFVPALLALLPPFNHSRFHEWAGTNTVLAPFPATIEWAERRQFTDAHWGAGSAPRPKAVGAPWETVVLLSQAAAGHDGALDVWVNVPVYATGADPADAGSYVYNLALLLRDGNAHTGGRGLDARAVVFVEHANELWLNSSTGSSVYAWNLAAAAAEVAAGGSPLNDDGATDPAVWARRRHAKRLREISLIFGAVFGAGAAPRGRVRPVFSWMQALPDSGADALEWLERIYGAGAAAASFAAYAVNAYRVPFVAPGESASDVYAALLLASDAAQPARAASAALAARFALPLFSYEGAGWPQAAPGDNATLATIIEAQRGWPMASLERYDVLANWLGTAGPASAYNFYCLAGPAGPFNLGMLEQMRDLANATQTPKFAGVLELVYGPGG